MKSSFRTEITPHGPQYIKPDRCPCETPYVNNSFILLYLSFHWTQTIISFFLFFFIFRVKSLTSRTHGLKSQPRLVDIIAAVPPAYKKVGIWGNVVNNSSKTWFFYKISESLPDLGLPTIIRFMIERTWAENFLPLCVCCVAHSCIVMRHASNVQ